MNQPIEKLLSYELGMTAHMLQNDINRKFSGLGLTRSQSNILFLLYKEGSMTQAELMQRLNVQGSTMNGLLETMLKKELIRKMQSREDRRSRVISLTEKGMHIEEEMWTSLEQAETKITSALSQEEGDELRRLLKKVRITFREEETK
ncbi:MarR family winged helix-turn-helix transcriptional regulator [Alkalicoccus luteus]|uniref:MarR family transcriptional regulator n=1 Tax=Alkalicoccus luteus TaxID=1237094 RepID=A0A969Q1C7_9BACI|nr:MarR family transcriptional regulator [Alkalicoccus luteus]NJP39287.1 MarR family transcriptional regulator [Alkalicoccus luteus]